MIFLIATLICAVIIFLLFKVYKLLIASAIRLWEKILVITLTLTIGVVAVGVLFAVLIDIPSYIQRGGIVESYITITRPRSRTREAGYRRQVGFFAIRDDNGVEYWGIGALPSLLNNMCDNARIRIKYLPTTKHILEIYLCTDSLTSASSITRVALYASRFERRELNRMYNSSENYLRIYHYVSSWLFMIIGISLALIFFYLVDLWRSIKIPKSKK